MEFITDDLLTSKLEELQKTNKKLNKAKEEAMQSWLDSRPLIDELEKLQADLAATKLRITKSNATITEIQAQIATTDTHIKSTKEKELKLRTIINEQDQELHRTQEEMEQIKLKIDQKRRMRSKLKQEVKFKKHTLRTLELTCDAIMLESQAFQASEVEALRYVSHTEAVDVMVRLTGMEYETLKREAREETSLAELRISVSMEEKLAAENSRDSAFRRLEQLYRNNVKEKKTVNEDSEGSEANSRHDSSTKAPAKSPAGINKRRHQERERMRNDKHGHLSNKRRSSLCFRIKRFFVRRLSKYFK